MLTAIEIAIDHGNKQIKTSCGKMFVSGLLESENMPPFGNDVIKYNGKYYSLTEQRMPYLRDKSSDERFFILSLFAFAYEIDAAGRYADNDVICLKVITGLPPAHFGLQYEKFEKYFSDRKDIIEFEFNRRPYHVYIEDVMCFPQAYAAAIPIIGHLKEYNQSIIIDLGGYTLDYLRLKDGQPDLSVCDSLENGVIHMYNAIKSKVNADYDFLLDESGIDSVIEEKKIDYPANIIQTIERQAQNFVNDMIGKLRERSIDLKSIKAVFVGGGSILLKKYIEASDKVNNPIFIDNIAANVRGYELLYRACNETR